MRYHITSHVVLACYSIEKKSIRFQIAMLSQRRLCNALLSSPLYRPHPTYSVSPIPQDAPPGLQLSCWSHTISSSSTGSYDHRQSTAGVVGLLALAMLINKSHVRAYTLLTSRHSEYHLSPLVLLSLSSSRLVPSSFPSSHLPYHHGHLPPHLTSSYFINSHPILHLISVSTHRVWPHALPAIGRFSAAPPLLSSL